MNPSWLILATIGGILLNAASIGSLAKTSTVAIPVDRLTVTLSTPLIACRHMHPQSDLETTLEPCTTTRFYGLQHSQSITPSKHQPRDWSSHHKSSPRPSAPAPSGQLRHGTALCCRRLCGNVFGDWKATKAPSASAVSTAVLLHTAICRSARCCLVI